MLRVRDSAVADGIFWLSTFHYIQINSYKHFWSFGLHSRWPRNIPQKQPFLCCPTNYFVPHTLERAWFSKFNVISKLACWQKDYWTKYCKCTEKPAKQTKARQKSKKRPKCKTQLKNPCLKPKDPCKPQKKSGSSAKKSTVGKKLGKKKAVCKKKQVEEKVECKNGKVTSAKKKILGKTETDKSLCTKKAGKKTIPPCKPEKEAKKKKAALCSNTEGKKAKVAKKEKGKKEMCKPVEPKRKAQKEELEEQNEEESCKSPPPELGKQKEGPKEQKTKVSEECKTKLPIKEENICEDPCKRGTAPKDENIPKDEECKTKEQKAVVLNPEECKCKVKRPVKEGKSINPCLELGEKLDQLKNELAKIGAELKKKKMQTQSKDDCTKEKEKQVLEECPKPPKKQVEKTKGPVEKTASSRSSAKAKKGICKPLTKKKNENARKQVKNSKAKAEKKTESECADERSEEACDKYASRKKNKCSYTTNVLVHFAQSQLSSGRSSLLSILNVKLMFVTSIFNDALTLLLISIERCCLMVKKKDVKFEMPSPKPRLPCPKINVPEIDCKDELDISPSQVDRRWKSDGFPWKKAPPKEPPLSPGEDPYSNWKLYKTINDYWMRFSLMRDGAQMEKDVD